MKEKFYVPLLLIIGIGLVFSSCQKEKFEYVDETNNEETIAVNSELARMLISASQNNGSVDDIIDGSSCTSVVLPVSVYANNQLLTIQTISDLQLIQDIFDQFPNDTDTIEIVFPINVVYEDYSEETIQSISDMATLIGNCQSFIADTYTCVDFEYPITCFIYNSTNEQTGLVTLQNDYEWFDYLTYLTEEILIAIDYEMTVIFDDEAYTVNNNQELFDVFNQSFCDVGGGSTIDPQVDALRSVMKNGSWTITQYLDNGDDETSDYAGYDFIFYESITVYAYNGSGIVSGMWAVSMVAENLNFEIDMESPLNGIDDDDYKVLNYTYNKVTFVTYNSDGMVEDTLIFERN